jgi:hypothetical protein
MQPPPVNAMALMCNPQATSTTGKPTNTSGPSRVGSTPEPQVQIAPSSVKATL